MADADEMMERLKAIGFDRSTPFCYGCYKIAPSGRCRTCLSDDLMRHVDGVGVEYGVEWVIEHLLDIEFPGGSMDTSSEWEDEYEAELNEMGPDVEIMGCQYELGTLYKQVDPQSFEQGASGRLDDEDQYVYLFQKYFEVQPLEDWIEEQEDLIEDEDEDEEEDFIQPEENEDKKEYVPFKPFVGLVQ